jgi:hypothetical protein
VSDSDTVVYQFIRNGADADGDINNHKNHTGIPRIANPGACWLVAMPRACRWSYGGMPAHVETPTQSAKVAAMQY